MARKYPWGICNIELSSHSDIYLLHELLVHYFSDSMIELTQCNEEEFVDNQKSK